MINLKSVEHSNRTLGESGLSLPDINLVIQSLILFMFLASIVFKMKGKFRIHGTLMLAAVISSIATFLWFVSVKAPTFTTYMQRFLDQSLNFIAFVAHISLTVLAVLLGVWVVGSWRFRTNLFCASKKKVMRLIAILWILGYFVGVLLYLVVHTNLIA